jgi:SWI/SNF-related matrix-associated actin-dependent regulator 1 of chromatin subfamily A
VETFDLKTPYDPDLVSRVKSLQGRRWNPDRKVWVIDARHLLMVAGWCEARYPDVATRLRTAPEYEEARQAAGAAIASVAASRATDAAIDVPAPEGREYLPFQRAGIAYAAARPATLIADEMGLGKTVQAIGLVNASPDVKSVLVVCPASLRLNWAREWARWTTRHDLGAPVVVESGKTEIPADARLVICNYDLIGKFPALASREWGLVISDESHHLKNPKAQRTGHVLGSKTEPGLKARRWLLLTGTPILNRPIELWPLLHKLDPDGLGRNWKRYAERYCAGHTETVWTGRATGYRDVYKCDGASNLGELQERLRGTCMVRRLKADVLTELPAKRRQIMELPANGASKAVRAESAALARHEAEAERLTAEAELAKAGGDEGAYREAVARLRGAAQVAFTEMAAMRHQVAMAKVPAVIEHLAGYVEAGTKVVVFAHHVDVISALVAGLRELGQEPAVLTGSTSLSDRQAAVDRFQGDPKVLCFVGNIQAAGVGITLTAASHIVFSELPWTPGELSQAEDRCHRIGQRESVSVVHLVVDGSLDAHMAQVIVAKQDVIDRALDDPEAVAAMAQEPLLPLRQSAASSETPRSKLHAEAAAITPAQVAAVHEALRRLAEACDGAAARDGTGFNKVDTRIGKSLAALDSLTAVQAALGRKIARKYARQLPEMLIAAMTGGGS